VQVAALNAFQQAGRMHPFTCGSTAHTLDSPTLIAQEDGWYCPHPECDYRQTWALAAMADSAVLAGWQSPFDRTDALLAASEAEGQAGRDRQQLQFIHAVLTLALHADFRSELLWHSDGTTITVAVDVSDVFAWGGSDAEDLTPERLPLLAQAVADLRAIDPREDMYAVDLFAARIRGMRPQGAAYPKRPALAATHALFDACGPERATGLGNPRRPPEPEGA
jgi:hypothetical protein